MLPIEIHGIITNFIFPKKEEDTISVFSLDSDLPLDIIKIYFMYSKLLNKNNVKDYHLSSFRINLLFLIQKHCHYIHDDHFIIASDRYLY